MELIAEALKAFKETIRKAIVECLDNKILSTQKYKFFWDGSNCRLQGYLNFAFPKLLSFPFILGF